MNLNKKILVISMLVMLVCCVSAVSATDINGTDDISDDIIIDENPVDEITDVVEDAEIDEVEDDPVEEQQQNPVEDGTVNGYTYDYYFNTITGELVPSENLNFTGNFYAKDFGNFKIGKSITINATGAIFHNIGFDLTGPQITLNGGTFIFDEPTNITAGLNVTGNGATIQNTVINVTAPENSTFYAIDVESASNVKLLDNIINYTCNYTNAENFNYVIKGKNSADLNITGNTIYAYLPLKLVNWAISGSIDADYVAGIALEQCGNAKLIGNTVNVKGILRGGSFPTLDAIIIANSNDVVIEHNTITESDLVTVSGEANYIYGIDVYTCNNIKIGYNDVTMNGNKSGGHIEGNGTGAAYCIQVSGEYQGADIYYNTLTTSNEGPNLGIYAQNYAELDTHLNVYKNNITVTGKAGNDPWSLVSGIESQVKYSHIYENIVRVNNTAGYNSGNYAFGISYAQWINGTHDYNIHENHVEVINGDYAVYLINETVVTGVVSMNELIVIGNTTKQGDDAVFAPSTTVQWNY